VALLHVCVCVCNATVCSVCTGRGVRCTFVRRLVRMFAGLLGVLNEDHLVKLAARFHSHHQHHVMLRPTLLITPFS
jgi:hypothetical protein